MFQTLFTKFASQILILLALAFWLVFTGAHLYFKEYELALFTLTAVFQLFIAVFCGLLIKRLHAGNFIDPLTGIGNRGYFYERLGHELKRSGRVGSPVSLVFIDIDNFKKVNDTYGHVQGDKLLRQMAVTLKENVREVDSVARWGGEEFAIVLPDTAVDGGMLFAERLRGLIENMDFGSKVTISVGVASNVGTVDIDKFVSLADNALYHAKDRKNSVVRYDSLIEK